MIAYNKTWLANSRLHNIMRAHLNTGNINDQEFATVKQAYPVDFYTPNWFVRAGLFMMTIILIFFSAGLLSLVMASSWIVFSGSWFVFLAIVCFIALEMMIRQRFHYQSGVDDALLLIGGCLLYVAFYLMFEKMEPTWRGFLLSFTTTLVGIALTLRYAHPLAALTAGLAFFAMIFFGWAAAVARLLNLLPFVTMLLALGVYVLMSRIMVKANFINYRNCILIAQVIALVILYAAGNYYVVQTLNAGMMHHKGPVAFGELFWILTMLMPFIYIILGLKRKDYTLLRIGLLLVIAAVATFRFYYHLLPTDVALTLAGSAILMFIYAVTQYLKSPKLGLTLKEQQLTNNNSNLEALLVGQTFSHTALGATLHNNRFGGGDFGGGGSSANF